MGAVHILRARALQADLRYLEALDVLAAAAQDDPGNPTVQSLRAISLAGLEQFDEALRTARAALHLAPTDPFGHFVLAKVLLQRGDGPGSRASIEIALQHEPGNADYHGVLAATYQIEYQYARALDAIERGLKHDPENRICLLLKASLHDLRGDEDLALSTVRDILRID